MGTHSPNPLLYLGTNQKLIIRILSKVNHIIALFFIKTIDILSKIAYTIGDRTRKVTVYYIVNKKSKGGYLYSFLILGEEIRTRNLMTITFF